MNVVPGWGEEAGAALARHPGTAKLAFTGSGEVGRVVAQIAGATGPVGQGVRLGDQAGDA